MRLKPNDATEYLRDSLSPMEFSVEVTADEFEQLYLAVRELRGRSKWIEPFVTDDALNALLREIARADLEIRFRETFPAVSEVEWAVHIGPRPARSEAELSCPGPSNRSRKALRSSRK
jgi:hypothetical protein